MNMLDYKNEMADPLQHNVSLMESAVANYKRPHLVSSILSDISPILSVALMSNTLSSLQFVDVNTKPTILDE